MRFNTAIERGARKGGAHATRLALPVQGLPGQLTALSVVF
jgi:hypothetical protein